MKLFKYVAATGLLLTGALSVSTSSAQNKPGGTQSVATPVSLPSAYTNPGLNFIRSWAPEAPLTDTSATVLASKTAAEVKQTTQYFDGLGRPVQTVTKGISSGGKDLVETFVYDAESREAYKYLPYVQHLGNTSDGKFKNDPFFIQKLFYRHGVLNPGVSGDSIFYSKIEFEASPLERKLKTFDAGSSWAARPVENQYLISATSDSVRVWNISTGLPVSTGVYAAGELFENVVINEEKNKVVEYKNKGDQVVLRKVQIAATPGTGHIGWLCTYYVYDDLGKVRLVMPPLATEAVMRSGWTISTAVANELCLQYQYDDQQRLIVKKIPGADAIYMVYDVRDRLVFMQDGVQRSKSPAEWQVTFYDGLNRPQMTAIYTTTATMAQLQADMNTVSTKSISYVSPLKEDLALFVDDGSLSYQATNSITFLEGFDSSPDAEFSAEIVPGGTETTVIQASNPLPSISSGALYPLTYHFYDDYSYTGCLPFYKDDLTKVTAPADQYPEAFPSSYSTMTSGLQTGQRVRVLGTNTWLTKTTYYNDKGQAIQMVSDNSVGGKDVETTLYSFTNEILGSYLRHQNPTSNTLQSTLLTTMTYDHGSRLLTVKKILNDDVSQEKTIMSNSYDELGRLKLKKLGVSSAGSLLDTLNYSYNVRGWLQSINKNFVNDGNNTSNWYGQELSYDNGFDTSRYTGDIGGIKWKTRSDSVWAFGYSYDRPGRLVRADFTQRNGTAWVQNKKDFSMKDLAYDANGNILSMSHKGLIGTITDVIDQMTYTYMPNSNRLLSVTDPNPSKTATAQLGDFIDGANAGNDYVYDLNGNLTKDANKQIDTIIYNHLNLPITVKMRGKGVVSYQYDALGTKLSKTIVDSTASSPVNTVTNYSGSFVYKRDSLELIFHEEGRIRPIYRTGNPITYAYDYFEKDHLDNVRVVLTDQTDFTMYAATMETASAQKETALFSNVEQTRTEKPSGYPEDKTTEKNSFVAKLNAKTGGNKIGPAIIIRVMPGDTVQIRAKAFYKSDGPVDNGKPPVEDMIAGLAAAFGGTTSSSAHGAVSANQTPFNADFYNNTYERLREKNKDGQQGNRPKAYLNFVLFDDEFKLVEDNSGVRQVKTNPDALQDLQVDKMPIKNKGFLYIYTSNESQQDVYFDNVVLAVNSGPLLEETHYYPYGLVMAGMSSTALKGANYSENRRKYNKNELQSKEFGDGSGLELYDFNARTYNAQIGRFNQIDPLIESGNQEVMTPYHFGFNNPARFNDPDGKIPPFLIGMVVGGGLELAGQLLSGKSLKEVDWMDVGVEALKGGIATTIPGAGAGGMASKAAKIAKVALDVGAEVLKASVDVTKKDGVKVIGGSKTYAEAGTDFTIGYAGGLGWGRVTAKVEGVTKKALEKAEKNSAAATKTLLKANAKVERALLKFGGNSEQAKAAVPRAKAALSKYAQAQSKQANAQIVNAVVPKVVSAGLGSVNNRINDQTKLYFGITSPSQE